MNQKMANKYKITFNRTAIVLFFFQFYVIDEYGKLHTQTKKLSKKPEY